METRSKSLTMRSGRSYLAPASSAGTSSRRRKPSSVVPNQCAICLENMTRSLRGTPCKHIFHGSCLKDWRQHATTCPTCRRDIRMTIPDFIGTNWRTGNTRVWNAWLRNNPHMTVDGLFDMKLPNKSDPRYLSFWPFMFYAKKKLTPRKRKSRV